MDHYGAVESEAITHIGLEMSEMTHIEVLLSENVMVSYKRGMFVENYLEGNSAFIAIPNADEIQKLFNECEDRDKVMRIILTKEHPMFNTIIKMAEVSQVLS